MKTKRKKINLMRTTRKEKTGIMNMSKEKVNLMRIISRRKISPTKISKGKINPVTKEKTIILEKENQKKIIPPIIIMVIGIIILVVKVKVSQIQSVSEEFINLIIINNPVHSVPDFFYKN